MLTKLAFAFLGGLILNLMPCVLPVISLKILAFLEQAGESRGRVFLLNVWYSAGLLSVFMVLAALAATAGFAWGEQFTLTWFKVAMTAVVFAMALSFLGVWEIPIPGFVGAGRAGQLQTKEGPSGAFFKGVFATILATPCSGPFLGPVFGYLLKQPPYMAYWIFGAVGLGMASPYLTDRRLPQADPFPPQAGRMDGDGAAIDGVPAVGHRGLLVQHPVAPLLRADPGVVGGAVVRVLVDRTDAADGVAPSAQSRLASAGRPWRRWWACSPSRSSCRSRRFPGSRSRPRRSSGPGPRARR